MRNVSGAKCPQLCICCLEFVIDEVLFLIATPVGTMWIKHSLHSFLAHLWFLKHRNSNLKVSLWLIGILLNFSSTLVLVLNEPLFNCSRVKNLCFMRDTIIYRHCSILIANPICWIKMYCSSRSILVINLICWTWSDRSNSLNIYQVPCMWNLRLARKKALITWPASQAQAALLWTSFLPSLPVIFAKCESLWEFFDGEQLFLPERKIICYWNRILKKLGFFGIRICRTGKFHESAAPHLQIRFHFCSVRCKLNIMHHTS